jgi:hypothetical protein
LRIDGSQAQTSAMRIPFLCFIASTLLLAGCASTPSNTVDSRHRGWLVGTLTCSDGNVLNFLIQKKMVIGGSASGGVYATNTVTGKEFEGQYTGIMDSGSSRGWATGSAWGSGGYATGTAESYGRWQSEIANTQAFLNNNKGTIIQLRLQIHAGWIPHGFGGGRDNHGKDYQVQF